MKLDDLSNFPSSIICLTEESVETLYLLEMEHLISGVSAFVKRPLEAQKLPKVSLFTSSNYKKILSKKPELIIGHSDIQKDIARDLIELGQNVYIANHRSIAGIIQYIGFIGKIVGAFEKAQKLQNELVEKVKLTQELTQSLQNKPKIYFEEWDEPQISAIKWVGEVIEICGGENIFKEKSQGLLAKERFVEHQDVISANPDIIFGCWCGKKVNIESIYQRKGYEKVSAIKNKRVYELPPEIFLQPGPAPLIDGIDIILKYVKEFNSED